MGLRIWSVTSSHKASCLCRARPRVRQEPARQGCFQPAPRPPPCKQPLSRCFAFCAPQRTSALREDQPRLSPSLLLRCSLHTLWSPRSPCAPHSRPARVCAAGEPAAGRAPRLLRASPAGPQLRCWATSPWGRGRLLPGGQEKTTHLPHLRRPELFIPSPLCDKGSKLL